MEHDQLQGSINKDPISQASDSQKGGMGLFYNLYRHTLIACNKSPGLTFI